jgi:hypothetical protein
MHRLSRLFWVLGSLPLVIAVGQDEAAVIGMPHQAAVGGFLVHGLGAGVDHGETSVEVLGPVRQEPPADRLDTPAFCGRRQRQAPPGWRRC